jgi:hypothetical protein
MGKQQAVVDVDWFTEHSAAWESILAPRFAGKPRVRILALGPFDGRCLRWLFDNVATKDGCRATLSAKFDIVYIDARGTKHAMEAAVMAFR